MQIEYSKRFIKEFKKCPDYIKKAFKVRLIIFIDNQQHPILNNHQLTGKLKDYSSININGDWRGIFQIINSGEIIYFVAIGTHSRLYS
jgi:addiction module RelE/StbE family toxin